MPSQAVHLIDASPYIFRAWFALPSSLVDRAGNPTAAVYGFTSFLLAYLDEQRPTHLALTFDESLNTSFRNELYPEYKPQRDLPPAELEAQLADCQAVGQALGLATFVSERYEADDLIATLCKPLEREGHDVTVVTSDKDLAQLVSDRVTLFDYAKGERFGPPEVVAKFGVRPEQIADYLGLAGDSVDNIPGVAGVGAKTAAALLTSFADLAAIYADLEAVSKLPIRGAAGVARKLEASRELAFLSRELATVAVDAPIDWKLDELLVGEPDDPAIEELFERLAFDTLLKRVRKLQEGRSGGAAPTR